MLTKEEKFLLQVSPTDNIEKGDLLEKYKNPNYIKSIKDSRTTSRESQNKMCHNDSTIRGNNTLLLSEQQLILYKDIVNEKTFVYCFGFDDINGLLETKKNPYTKKKLSSEFLDHLQHLKNNDWRYGLQDKIKDLDDVIKDFIRSMPPKADWNENDVLYYIKNQLGKDPKDIKELYIRTNLRSIRLPLLPNLERLAIHANLREIALPELPKLAKLNLNNNKLITIPSGIENQSNLLILSLDNNRISYISNNLFKLKKLIYLSLNNNFLSEIPLRIIYLINLMFLYLNDNPITNIDQFENILKYKLELLSIYEINPGKYTRIFDKTRYYKLQV